MKEDVLSAAKSSLIDLIKREGEISVGRGSEALDLAKTTVRQHLSSLESKGFLDTRRHRHGRGRPRKMYSLTEKAESFFENRSTDFLKGLLEDLIERGHGDLIEEFIDRESAQIRRQMQRDGFESDDLLEELEELLRRRGFMPRVDETSDVAPCLTLGNCPYREVVDVTTHICKAEQETIERMLDCRLERIEHMATGDKVCRYRIVDD